MAFASLVDIVASLGLVSSTLVVVVLLLGVLEERATASRRRSVAEVVDRAVVLPGRAEPVPSARVA